MAPRSVAADHLPPVPGMPSLRDLALVATGVAFVWRTGKAILRRRERQRQRFELRDRSLLMLLRTQASVLGLIAARPCMLGHSECTPDTSADVRAQSQVAVLLDRLQALEQEMAANLGEQEEGKDAA